MLENFAFDQNLNVLVRFCLLFFGQGCSWICSRLQIYNIFVRLKWIGYMKRGNSIAFSNIRAYVSVTESSLNLFPIILKNSDIQRYVLFRVEFYFWSFTSEMTSEMSVLWHVHVLIQTMLFVHMLIAFVFITTRKKKTQTKSILLVFVVLNEDIIYTSKHLFNLLANVESCELMISVMLWSFLGKKIACSCYIFRCALCCLWHMV